MKTVQWIMYLVIFNSVLSLGIHAQTKKPLPSGSKSEIREGGNGGDVWKDPKTGKYYLWDLVEGNLHKNPFISSNLTPESYIVEVVEKELPFLSKGGQHSLSIKIQEIAQYSSAFAYVLVKAIELYDWIPTDFSLLDINNRVRAIDGAALEQAGGRFQEEIFVNTKLIKKLEPSNLHSAVELGVN